MLLAVLFGWWLPFVEYNVIEAMPAFFRAAHIVDCHVTNGAVVCSITLPGQMELCPNGRNWWHWLVILKFLHKERMWVRLIGAGTPPRVWNFVYPDFQRFTFVCHSDFPFTPKMHLTTDVVITACGLQNLSINIKAQTRQRPVLLIYYKQYRSTHNYLR